MKKATAAEATEEELRRAAEIYERLRREHHWDYLNVSIPSVPRREPAAAAGDAKDAPQS